MSRIFWDSNLFVYLLEDYGAESERVAGMSLRMIERGDQLLTSALTLGEVTVKARRAGEFELCRRYEEAIVAAAEIVVFGVEAARVYSQLRADESRNIRAADAMQLACAAAAQSDLFVTNDRKLQALTVAGIHFITSVERAPF